MTPSAPAATPLYGRAVIPMVVPCAVSPTDGSGLPASCFNGECYSTPTMVRRQRRRSQRSLSSTGTDIPSSRPTFGKAPRASAVREAAQRHWHKSARNVLGSGSTVLRSTGREGAPHDSKRRRFVKHSNLITGRKSHHSPSKPSFDGDVRILDNLRPTIGLRLHHRCKFFRGASNRLSTLFFKPRSYHGAVDRVDCNLPKLGDNLLRRALRDNEAIPSPGVIALPPTLRHSRNIGKFLRARRGRNGQRP